MSQNKQTRFLVENKSALSDVDALAAVVAAMKRGASPRPNNPKFVSVARINDCVDVQYSATLKGSYKFTVTNYDR